MVLCMMRYCSLYVRGYAWEGHPDTSMGKGEGSHARAEFGSWQVPPEKGLVKMKTRTKSFVGIAEDFVPRVHYVEDRHILPQPITRQHRPELREN